MQDIRNELGIKSLRWKVEKRVLDRMRMDVSRQVKAAVLGWMEDLENYEKRPGKKRKTILYWKKLIKEAGLDVTKIDILTKNRDEWRGLVRERMRHLERWERAGGKRSTEERGERNITRVDTEEDLICEWEGCGRQFKSKGGLTIHRRRVHEISKEKVMFKCQRCEEEFSQQANLKNHAKVCTGLKAQHPDKRKCDKCLNEYYKKNFAAHYRGCNAAEGGEREVMQATQYQPIRGPCDLCGIEKSLSNMAKHKRVCPMRAAVLE